MSITLQLLLIKKLKLNLY